MAFNAGSRRTGLTLIEVLVVVAVIALLISILMPCFSQARALARQSACLCNLKQIGDAMSVYMGSYRDSLPVGPADRLKYRDINTGILCDEPGQNRRPYPLFNCAWGGKRAAVVHDYQTPPRPEVCRRPLTEFLYKRAGLDESMPLFACPSDQGLASMDSSWVPAGTDNHLKVHELCGNSYHVNVWEAAAGNEGLFGTAKRLRSMSMLVLAEDAPMFYSIKSASQRRGWHTRYSAHNTLFLDFHAANLYIDPTVPSPSQHGRQWQGPGWFAVSYADLLDYFL